MISKLFFTNPSKVHPGPCTHVFLSTANTSLGRSEIFDLVLASKALLWVGQRDNSSSNKVYLPSDAAGFWPKIFYFYKVCIPTPWIFALAGFSAISDLETLRVGALFVHSLYCGSQSAREGSPFFLFLFLIFLEVALKWYEENWLSALRFLRGPACFWGCPFFLAGIQFFQRI